VWLLNAAQRPANGALQHMCRLNITFVIAGSTAEPSISQPASQERPQVVLLLCVAQQMLLEQSKALDTARMAAFTKSLSCAALHLESGAAMGSLSLVNRLLRWAFAFCCMRSDVLACSVCTTQLFVACMSRCLYIQESARMCVACISCCLCVILAA